MSQIAFPYEPFALGGIVAASQSITSIANTNGLVVVFTLTAHGYMTGQYVRTAGITGQTTLNGNWVINVITANTFSLLSTAGTSTTSAPLGNGVSSAAGTIAATPISITVNRPAYAGMSVAAHALSFQIYPGNTGSVYIGVIIPGKAFMTNITPFTDTLFILKNSLLSPQNLPIFSPGNSNLINIDDFFIDYDTIGDGVLVTAFQR